ncbi:uncharacterized protein LOC122724914 [Manihot esculenta]|uniref:uncharacterized protein LOC122724914 n=1 Tax=Manihot esculenta TaxID=3983 RepID=UPI001CC57BC7|nr:uncharacterized protein LOC122724914 [Manihot esculenta]
MFVSNLRDIQDTASDVKMDQIKPPKNLVLSRESMNAALDALRAGLHVSEVAEEVAQIVSSRKVSRPPARASSRAPKPSSCGAGSSRPSSRGRSTSAPKPAQESRSNQAFIEEVREAPRVIAKQTEDIEQARSDLALSSEEVLGGRFGSPIIEEEAPRKGMEVVLVEENVLEAPIGDAPAPVGTGSGSVDGGVTVKTGDKRLAPPEISPPTPARKKSRASKGSAPALPPIGKEKDVPVVPLLSAPDNDILNAKDITHQSLASVVAEILKERMFGGITEASDPCLLALTGLLASSTKEQAAFRSRPREELEDMIREMLLMARLEENLSATSDARGNLTAAREHSESLWLELHTALEALKRADVRASEAQEHAKSLEAELSHTRGVLKESNERVAAAEVRCEEVLKQLSSIVETLRERNEAISQKDEVQRQYEALKADFEEIQAHIDKVEIQKEGALAQVEILEQELSTSSERIRDLASSAEESKLHNQQLSHEVRTLERKCSALLEETRHAENKIQLECERRLTEYQESDELKRKIEQACEAYLQDYKDSPELKAIIAEACESQLAEYKASDEMKTAVWQKGFRIFATGFNRGLREARLALDIPLAKLRVAEVDSDGENVLYGEDDFPLPRGTSRIAAESSSEESELDGEGVDVLELGEDDFGPQEGDVELGEEGASPSGLETVPFVGTDGSELEDARPPSDVNVNVNKDSIGDDVPRNVSPLRTFFPQP